MYEEALAELEEYKDTMEQAGHCTVVEVKGVSVEPMWADGHLELRWEGHNLSYRQHKLSTQVLLEWLITHGWIQTGKEVQTRENMTRVEITDTVYTFSRRYEDSRP